MSARLKELLTDYALGVASEGIVDELLRLKISQPDLDDAFFDAFDWRQRNRIYMVLSVCAAPAALEILQRRLAVEENGFCRKGLQGTIGILMTPIAQLRAHYAAACNLFAPPARNDEFKRAFRAAIRQFGSDARDTGCSVKIKEMAPNEDDFEDGLFDSLPPKARLAIYEELPKWCGQLALKKILDRRAQAENDAACHAAIAEMLEPFNGPAIRFNWKADD